MKVLIIGRFPERSRQRILRSFPEEWEICITDPERAELFLNDADVLIPEHIRVDDAFLERAPALRLVQTGAGYDNIDIAACTKRGIRVCNAAGVNANAVAEHTMALTLNWYKNICTLDRFTKAGWDEASLDYTGAELSGKTVGILGLGAIGRRVAQLCTAFDMRVLGYTRSPIELPGVELAPLDRLYGESDVVSVHMPLNDATYHMIDRKAFAAMKETALLVNTARGAITAQDDLIEALRTHRIGGACLDVYEEEPLPTDSPLLRLPNVILTPHTAGLPDGAKFHEKRYAFFVSNITKLLNGQTPDNALK